MPFFHNHQKKSIENHLLKASQEKPDKAVSFIRLIFVSDCL